MSSLFDNLSNNGQNQVNVITSKINPTKYEILIPFIDKDLQIQFRESFSSQWKFLLNNSVDKAQEAWWTSFFYTELIDSQHTIFADYGNQWSINPKKLCMNLDNKCLTLTQDNKKYLVATIEYIPQRLMHLLSWLSVIGLLATFLLLKLKKYQVD